MSQPVKEPQLSESESWGSLTGWRGAPHGAPRCFLGGYAPVGRDPCVPPKNAYPAAGHTGHALRDGMLNRAKRDVEDAVPYTFNPSGHKSPSKSQQFHAKFCAPIQNVKIPPETVADGLQRCYIRPIHRKYTIYGHPWVSRVAAVGGNADGVFAKSNFT